MRDRVQIYLYFFSSTEGGAKLAQKVLTLRARDDAAQCELCVRVDITDCVTSTLSCCRSGVCSPSAPCFFAAGPPDRRERGEKAIKCMNLAMLIYSSPLTRAYFLMALKFRHETGSFVPFFNVLPRRGSSAE